MPICAAVPDTFVRVSLGSRGSDVYETVHYLGLELVASAQAFASEASVDRLTQRALDLDAHAERGGVEFRQSCSRCHGALAQGDAAHAIPALAGQRFKYVVRQLANFAGDERESATMQRVIFTPRSRSHKRGSTSPLT